MYKTKHRVGLHVTDLNNLSKNQKKHVSHCTLNIDEYLTIALCWSCSIFEVMNISDKIRIHGSITLIIIGILRMAFSVPVTMVYLFFGKYTRRGYITFWEILPVFKGLAWTMSIYLLLVELFNVSLASLALLNIKNILSVKDSWRFCKFPEASEKCWPANPENSYDSKCLKNETLSLSAIEYFLPGIRRHHFNVYLRDLANTNLPWVGSNIFTWCVIFFLLRGGTREIVKTTTPFAKICWILLIIPTLLVMLVLRGRYAVPTLLKSGVHSVFTIKYWCYLFRTCISSSLPGNLIVLGSYLPKGDLPTGIAFCIYGSKMLLLIILMVWYSISLWTVKKNYKVTNFKCLIVSGFELFFAVIPDALSTFPFSTVFIIMWFFSIWLYGILSTIFTLISLVTSLIDRKPKLLKRKNGITATLCFLCCSCNVLMLNPAFAALLELFQRTFANKLTLIIYLVFCITLSIYSVQVIADDFFFLYKKSLSKYWIYSLNSLPLLVIVSFLYQAQNAANNYIFRQPLNIRILALVIVCICLVPAILVSLKVYFYFMKLGKLTSAFKQTPMWGPPTLVEKVARLKLNSAEEYYYNSKNECKHNCLLNSEDLQLQIKSLSRNKVRLMQELQQMPKDT